MGHGALSCRTTAQQQNVTPPARTNKGRDGFCLCQFLTPSECCPVWCSAAVAPLQGSMCRAFREAILQFLPHNSLTGYFLFQTVLSKPQRWSWVKISVDQASNSHATFKVTEIPFLYHSEAQFELEHGVLTMAAIDWLNSYMQLNSVPKKQSGSCV